MFSCFAGFVRRYFRNKAFLSAKFGLSNKDRAAVGVVKVSSVKRLPDRSSYLRIGPDLLVVDEYKAVPGRGFGRNRPLKIFKLIVQGRIPR